MRLCPHAWWVCAGAAGLLASASLGAQWRFFESDFDEERKPWIEIQAQLPPAPKKENLIPFDAGAATSHQFMIDAASVSIGEDGVVRYTLVVRTSGGATNVSFEGMRCEMQQNKVYAFGRSDGTWSRARDPQWRRVEYQELNRHHGVLYADYLCRGKNLPRNTKEIIDGLRFGTAKRGF